MSLYLENGFKDLLISHLYLPVQFQGTYLDYQVRQNVEGF